MRWSLVNTRTQNSKLKLPPLPLTEYVSHSLLPFHQQLLNILLTFSLQLTLKIKFRQMTRFRIIWHINMQNFVCFWFESMSPNKKGRSPNASLGVVIPHLRGLLLHNLAKARECIQNRESEWINHWSIRFASVSNAHIDSFYREGRKSSPVEINIDPTNSIFLCNSMTRNSSCFIILIYFPFCCFSPFPTHGIALAKVCERMHSIHGHTRWLALHSIGDAIQCYFLLSSTGCRITRTRGEWSGGNAQPETLSWSLFSHFALTLKINFIYFCFQSAKKWTKK